jgi:hypothetical protein
MENQLIEDEKWIENQLKGNKKFGRNFKKCL